MKRLRSKESCTAFSLELPSRKIDSLAKNFSPTTNGLLAFRVPTQFAAI
ncbi:MAG: hypothetical protein ACI9HK_003699 [Pirellulaceae bacterium]|jgi:hypothetical protein